MPTRLMFVPVLVICFALPAVSASATEGVMIVTSDTTLTEDHQGTIQIEADDVILDCAGHTVTGGSSSGTIISLQTSGVTVRNCRIEDAPDVGLYGSFHRIVDNVIVNSGVSGIDVRGVGVTISGNQIIGAELWGILFGGEASAIWGNNIRYVAWGGLYIDAYSVENLVHSNVIWDSAGAIGIEHTAARNTVRNNMSVRNGSGFVEAVDGGIVNDWVDNICIETERRIDLCTYVEGEGRFVDDDANTFEMDIEWLAFEGLTRGCNPPVNIHYCPDDPVTRGELAVFLDRIFDYPDEGGGDLFVDDDGRFYEEAADRVKTAGITNGCNPPVNDRYCGDRPVTRGEFAALFVRAMGYTDDAGGDLFTDDDSSIFEEAIDRLATAGVTKGCNPPVNDMFCPDDNMTRGQIAAFFHRALGS